MWIEYGAIGFLAGILAGYLGIGGGLVLVPALTWLFSRDPLTSALAVHMAVATSLATMLVTSLSSILAHQRRRAIDWVVVRGYAPGLLAGAIMGAVVADRLATDQLASVFGGFAFLAGLQLMLSRNREHRLPLPGRVTSSAVALLIGAISSLVGIGGGSMTAPWLMWHGIRAQQAVATAAACGYPIAIAGTLTFVVLGGGESAAHKTAGYVHLPAFAGVAMFSVIGAPLGAWAVHRSPPAIVRRIFGVLLLLVAWKMIGGAF